MVVYNPVAMAPASGTSFGDWDVIMGGVKDIFSGVQDYNLEKKRMSYASQYGGSQTNLAGYQQPGDGFAGGMNYQKWGFILGAVGVGVAVLTFVLRK